MPKIDLARLYPRSPLVRLALRSLFFLALCLAPWPGLGGAFARTVNDVANWWTEEYTFPSGLMLRFEWAPDDIGADKANPAWHSIVRVRSVKTNASTRFALNTRSLFYVPSSVLVSLVLASGLWRRPRGRSTLAFGAVALGIFLLLSLIFPVTKFLGDGRIRAISLGPRALSYFDAAFNAWVVPPAMSYAVPGLIWLCMYWRTEGPRPTDHISGRSDSPPADE